MSTRVHLYSNLQRYTGNQLTVEVQGDTVGSCLKDLVRQYPALKPVLFDKSGNLQSNIYISLNLTSSKSEQIEKPVGAGDEIYLILIVAGG